AKAGVDDTGFISAVIADIGERYGVARSNLVGAGFSNGGMMIYRLLCESPGMFKSAVIVDATLAVASCRTGTTTADVMVIHQTGDDIVPYAGTTDSPLSIDGRLRSVDASLGIFLDAHRCTRAGRARVNKRVTTTRWNCDNHSVAERIVLQGGSHHW